MGSGGNSAQKNAERADKERQAQIADATGRINAVFNDPARAGHSCCRDVPAGWLNGLNDTGRHYGDLPVEGDLCP